MTNRNAVLIIDERDDLRDDLATICRHVFPGLQVDTTNDIDRATWLIQASSGPTAPYDAVIIGHKTEPSTTKENQADDPMAVASTWELDSNTVLIFLVPDDEHPNLIASKRLAADTLIKTAKGPRLVFLPGAEPDWAETFLDELRYLLHPLRIAGRLDQVIPHLSRGRLRTHSASSWILDSYGNQTDISMEILKIMSDIEAHWVYLHTRIRDEIRRNFRVIEKFSSVSLSEF